VSGRRCLRVPERRVPEVWGVTEVADYLDVQKSNLSGQFIPAGMPEPFQTIRAGRLWVADDIREWAPEFWARRERYSRKSA